MDCVRTSTQESHPSNRKVRACGFSRGSLKQDREKSWNFPGGKLEEGETPEACAKRETMEEIGLKIENLSDIYQGHFIFNGLEWKGYFYFAESVSGKAFVNEPDKIKGLKYIQNSEEVVFPAELSTCIHGVFTHKYMIQKITKWNESFKK